MAKKTQTKSDFIRHHLDLSAKEIVAKAKAAGHTIAPDLVYKVRDRTRMRTKATKAKAALVTPAPTTSTAPLSKSSFIRSLPASASVKEVVAAAAKRAAAHQDIPKNGVRNCNTLNITEDFGRGLALGSRSAALDQR